MPFSSNSGKAFSERLIPRLMSICKNKSIFDVGAGAGRYYYLLKDKLPGIEFNALEIWEPYIKKYALRAKYDNVINEDIRTFQSEKSYGVVLLGDILEHMTKQEAQEVYKKLNAISEYQILSIPIEHYPQGEYMGNPYEIHVKDDWSHEEVLASFPNIALSLVENEIGVYVGYNPEVTSKEAVERCGGNKYAVYGIYKNEEKFIERFLESVKDADEIVLCDTGSTDKTNYIIEEFKNKNPESIVKTYKICVSPWRFDDARNAALSFVDADIDICISMDMDEYIMKGWREILDAKASDEFTRYYHSFETISQGETQSHYLHERIHSRKGYTWKLPVHEILEHKDVNEKICWVKELVIYHEPDEEKSRQSYLKLLEQSVKERANVWKTWCFLADEYFRANQIQKALSTYDIALEIKDADRGYVHKMKYHIYKAQNNFEMALEEINKTIRLFPKKREPLFEKARFLYDAGYKLEALMTIGAAEELKERIIDYNYDENAWNEVFYDFKIRLSREIKQERNSDNE